MQASAPAGLSFIYFLCLSPQVVVLSDSNSECTEDEILKATLKLSEQTAIVEREARVLELGESSSQ